MNPSTTFLTLIRREFWEHRGLLWAPVAVAGLLVLFTLLAGGVPRGPIHVQVGGASLNDFVAAMTGERQRMFFGIVVAGLLVPQLVVAMLVTFFYLLDSLYSERKDRSILFWKSLPVSDAATVASKACVALVVVPALVFGLAMLVSLVVFGVLAAKYSGTPLATLVQWHTGDWLALQGVLLLNLLVAALWYAPIVAALLMISAAARRATVLWAVVPPIGLTLLEETIFNTNQVWAFLRYRFTGFFDAMGMGFGRAIGGPTDEQVRRVEVLYQKINAAPLLLNVDLWLGVAVALALLAAAVRLRRWRDDT
jgi:ABC-2 type transport system permease protein